MTPKVTFRDLIDTSLVAAASRIEMRLLSETRSVFEYLPKTSVYAQMRCEQMAVILQFSKDGDSLWVDSQMKNIRAETVSYGHMHQFSSCVDVGSDWNQQFSRITHGKYHDHQK